MVSNKIKNLAIDILLGELRPYVNEAKDVLANAARDTVESIITG